MQEETRIFSSHNIQEMNDPNVFIVILNHNNGSDTIECLESLFNLQYSNFTVIVCDNGSKDNSIELIQKWASGLHPAPHSFFQDNPFGCKIVPKPIPIHSLTVHQRINDFSQYNHFRLILLKNNDNLGFGAGCNTGLRLVLKDSSIEFVWILNNDTVVDPNALTHLVNKMKSDSSLGACGSTILYYHDPTTIQALGGFLYTPLTGKSRQIGHLKKFVPNASYILLEQDIEKKMYWIQGASMFLSKDFLDRVGLFSEDYFLYFEEQDFGIRSRQILRSGYASKSIIYHKEGRTTGSASFGWNKKSLISEFYLTRSRLVFTKKYYPHFLPFIYVSHLFLAIMRLCHLQWKNSLVVLLCSVFFNDLQRNTERNPYEYFLRKISKSKFIRIMSLR